MKAIVVDTESPNRDLLWQDAADPVASEGQVLVDIHASAVNRADLLQRGGHYPPPPGESEILGLEMAGVVAAAGPGASDWRVGDRVCALLGGGGYAERVAVDARQLLPVPDGWSFERAAAVPEVFLTAWLNLFREGALLAGETVLIHGASGSTGLAAVHVAKMVGATVIATGRRPDKLAVVAEQGADHVVTSLGEDGAPSFRTEVKALTDGRGVDVVYDSVGGAMSLESLRSVRFGARYLVVGWAATPFVAKGRGKRGAPNANQLPTNLIMMKGLDVLGCPTAISTHKDPSIRAARLAALDGWIAEGRLTPFVQKAYGLSEVREALVAKWESRFVGGCVVRP